MKKRPCPSNITFCPLMVLRVNPVFRNFNSDLFRLQAHFEEKKFGPLNWLFLPYFWSSGTHLETDNRNRSRRMALQIKKCIQQNVFEVPMKVKEGPLIFDKVPKCKKQSQKLGKTVSYGWNFHYLVHSKMLMYQFLR